VTDDVIKQTIIQGPRVIIDAHQHFWNLSRAKYEWLDRTDNEAINRSIEFADVEPLLTRNGIDRTVLVQAADNDEDTDYLLDVAAEHSRVAGVVVFVALDEPKRASARLDELRRNPLVVGVRNLIHDQPDPDWLLRPDVGEGLALLEERNIPFDIVSVLPRHLEHVPTLCRRYPALLMVIDHLSKPPIKADGHAMWRHRLAAAAESPHVFAKVSGLYPAAGPLDEWDVDDLRASFDTALEVFGPDRLMFGSDWPVSILAGGYDRVWDALAQLCGELDPDARDAILFRTAESFYGLAGSRSTR
jgi:L-fuconolactonase